MDGEKATDGGLERGSHPFFAAVIAVGEGDIMAITGIGYGTVSYTHLTLPTNSRV